ncbi:MAG TPA: hypothetical protein VL633_12805 [Bacteroidota bacterium]|jgi:hypothetical protein|nr:hypothetical protein [Bacteroidota bacterium]
MEKIIGPNNYLSKSSLPFQEIEERFDDWVRWIRTIAQTPEDSFTTQRTELKIDPGKHTPHEKSDYDQRVSEEWRWVDDGGESGEVV